MLLDAHSHLDKYTDGELDGVLGSIERQEILTISVSVDPPSFVRAREIAALSDLVIPAFGVHAETASQYVDSLDALTDLAESSPVIGEIGLDYGLITDMSTYPAQRVVFEFLLDVAHKQNKVVSVHCVGAEADTFEMMRNSRIDRAIIHWYSGPLDVLSHMIDAGFLFSVGVEVLHSDHIRTIAAAIPDDQLLAETDNPGGPAWVMGTRGLSDLLPDIISEIARTRKTTSHDIEATLWHNAVQLFEHDPHLEPWMNSIHA